GQEAQTRGSAGRRSAGPPAGVGRLRVSATSEYARAILDVVVPSARHPASGAGQLRDPGLRIGNGGQGSDHGGVAQQRRNRIRPDQRDRPQDREGDRRTADAPAMSKTAGIIGGIGPESTIEYYRLIVRAWREAKDDGSYPPIVINSIDLSRVVDLMTKSAFTELADLLLNEVQKLARAGADFGALAANTPHVVFDDL